MTNTTASPRPRVARNCICCESADLQKTPAILMPFVAHRVFDWKPVQIDETWGLRTIQNGHAYSICNTLACNLCGCIFLDIRFDDAELENLYRDYRGAEYTELREFYEPGYGKRNAKLLAGIDYLDDVEKFIMKHSKKPNRILDWGGDTGKNTPFRSAPTRHVYDISPRRTIPGTQFVSMQEAYTGQYEVVVCSNVLEHVSFPDDVIKKIIPCLRRNTLLYLEIPFEGLLKAEHDCAGAQKKHWHEHINFFTREAILLLCEKNGLDVLGIDTIDIENEETEHSLFQVACRLRFSA